MSSHKKGVDFFATEAGAEFERTLIQMAADKAYNTVDSYSANTDSYPDNTISFVNKHMEYIRNHPTVDPEHYLSNLRLMTRVR